MIVEILYRLPSIPWLFTPLCFTLESLYVSQGETFPLFGQRIAATYCAYVGGVFFFCVRITLYLILGGIDLDRLISSRSRLLSSLSHTCNQAKERRTEEH